MNGAPPDQRPPQPPPEPPPGRQPGNARWLEALLSRVSSPGARHWLADLRSRLPAWAPAAALMVGLASCWVTAGRSGDTVGESARHERARDDNDDLVGESQEGKASWYGGKFHGRRTASGERFNRHKLTAAHPKWPFGTRVRVTNLNNNRSVVVRINDRGPYGGRIIDVSEAAARKLRMIKSGVAPVRIEIVGRGK